MCFFLKKKNRVCNRMKAYAKSELARINNNNNPIKRGNDNRISAAMKGFIEQEQKRISESCQKTNEYERQRTMYKMNKKTFMEALANDQVTPKMLANDLERLRKIYNILCPEREGVCNYTNCKTLLSKLNNAIPEDVDLYEYGGNMEYFLFILKQQENKMF